MSLILDGTNGVSDIDGSASTPAIRGTDTNTGIFFPAADTIAFSEGGTEAMRITAAGRVAIGSTDAEPFGRGYATTLGISSSANAALEVNSATGNAAFVELGINGTRQLVISTDGSVPAIGTNPSLPLGFNTNATERMRIDSSGNAYIGATSTSASARINVVAGSQTCSYFSNTNSSDLFEVRGNVGGSSGTAMYVMPMRFGDSTLRGSIYWTGSAVQYNTSSDYRLKENIAPMTGALAKVAQLKPVTYTWKESGSSGQGFIAHELQEVAPDCVTGEKDAVDADGNPIHQGIDTSFLVATLTAALQEQQAIITDLKSRIEALEAK
jgi:hypothetical protein